jgi:hypothetical protein
MSTQIATSATNEPRFEMIALQSEMKKLSKELVRPRGAHFVA